MADVHCPRLPSSLGEPSAQASAAFESNAEAVDVSVLIVAYNSTALIESCIESIAAACTSQSFEILMIDNGDGSTEALVRDRYPRVRIVPSQGNVGFAAGNNALARKARGKFLLLLNPDMKLFPCSIDALFEGVIAYPNASAWGGVTVDENDRPDTGNAIPMPSLLAFFRAAVGRSSAANLPPERLEVDSQVDLLMGGFVMFNRAAWEQAGGLDERYFLYCEEVDLFYRLARMGHSFWRIAAARGYHAAGHGDGTSPIRVMYLAAGTAEFTRAHWSAPAATIGKTLFWIAAIERYAVGLFLGRRVPWLQSRAKAYRLIACRPRLWWFGYDKRRGLLAQLKERRDFPL